MALKWGSNGVQMVEMALKWGSNCLLLDEGVFPPRGDVGARQGAVNKRQKSRVLLAHIMHQRNSQQCPLGWGSEREATQTLREGRAEVDRKF